MSKASEFAEKYLKATKEHEAWYESQRDKIPIIPYWSCVYFNPTVAARVLEDGKCGIRVGYGVDSIEMPLEPKEALALRDWLTETFE